MTSPRIIEQAIAKVRPRLNRNVVTYEEAKEANKAWAIIRSKAHVEFEKELPDTLGVRLTDDELEVLEEYLDKVQAEVDHLYDIAHRDAVDE